LGIFAFSNCIPFLVSNVLRRGGGQGSSDDGKACSFGSGCGGQAEEHETTCGVATTTTMGSFLIHGLRPDRLFDLSVSERETAILSLPEPPTLYDSPPRQQQQQLGSPTAATGKPKSCQHNNNNNNSKKFCVDIELVLDTPREAAAGGCKNAAGNSFRLQLECHPEDTLEMLRLRLFAAQSKVLGGEATNATANSPTTAAAAAAAAAAKEEWSFSDGQQTNNGSRVWKGDEPRWEIPMGFEILNGSMRGGRKQKGMVWYPAKHETLTEALAFSRLDTSGRGLLPVVVDDNGDLKEEVAPPSPIDSSVLDEASDATGGGLGPLEPGQTQQLQQQQNAAKEDEEKEEETAAAESCPRIPLLRSCGSAVLPLRRHALAKFIGASYPCSSGVESDCAGAYEMTILPSQATCPLSGHGGLVSVRPKETKMASATG
jgi:hypothetical protein